MRTRAALSSLAANNRSCAAPIKRVGICGAGAMGAIYAHHFSKAPQFETLLVASGDRASTLRDTPWIINGHAHSLSTSGGVAVLDPQQAEAPPPLDLLVVAVKHQHLEQAIEEVAPLVDRTHTTILSVMNGLDSEERLMARFGEEAVLYCIALAMDSVRNGREVRYENAGRLSFGRADNSVEDERVVRVRDALNAAGLANETPVQMLKEMWWCAQRQLRRTPPPSSSVTSAPRSHVASGPVAGSSWSTSASTRPRPCCS
jgi:2-dehydropantoate 2-reductase